MKSILVLFFSFILASCGGASSSGGAPDHTANPGGRDPANVALESEGASVSATYDEVGAEYVIDGSTSTSFFWSANITSDSLTIDFGSVFALSEITIYTNDLSFSTSAPSKVVEISQDASNWLTTSQITGGDVPCVNSNTGNGRMVCEFGAVQSARYLRLTITAENSPELIQIYEIEAVGQ